MRGCAECGVRGVRGAGCAGGAARNVVPVLLLDPLLEPQRRPAVVAGAATQERRCGWFLTAATASGRRCCHLPPKVAPSCPTPLFTRPGNYGNRPTRPRAGCGLRVGCGHRAGCGHRVGGGHRAGGGRGATIGRALIARFGDPPPGAGRHDQVAVSVGVAFSANMTESTTLTESPTSQHSPWHLASHQSQSILLRLVAARRH